MDDFESLVDDPAAPYAELPLAMRQQEARGVIARRNEIAELRAEAEAAEAIERQLPAPSLPEPGTCAFLSDTNVPANYALEADGKQLTGRRYVGVKVGAPGSYCAMTSVELGDTPSAIVVVLTKKGWGPGASFGVIKPGANMNRGLGASQGGIALETGAQGVDRRSTPVRTVEGDGSLAVDGHKRRDLGKIGEGSRVRIEWRPAAQRLRWQVDDCEVVELEVDCRGWRFAVSGWRDAHSFALEAVPDFEATVAAELAAPTAGARILAEMNAKKAACENAEQRRPTQTRSAPAPAPAPKPSGAAAKGGESSAAPTLSTRPPDSAAAEAQPATRLAASVPTSVMAVYALAELVQAEAPPGVDRAKKEQHLRDGDFARIFQVSRSEFSAMASWKQAQLKKMAGLF